MKHKHWNFGTTKEGEAVTAYRLTQENGMSLTALDYGCAIQALCVPAGNGTLVDVVQGYDSLAEYEENTGFLGVAVGRVCNRIGKGAFTLNGREYTLAQNDRGNHLHGGLKGFNAYVWQAEETPEGLRFSRLSPDGEEGYPGNLQVEITYTLLENGLRIDYQAQSDADTLINLTNHSYFNLDGTNDVLGHSLCIRAETFCECDENCLPTGRLLAVAGTPLDFRSPKTVGQDLETPHLQMQYGGGYDHHFVVEGQGFRPVARLQGEKSRLCMEVKSDAPGVQLYTSNGTTPRKGKQGGEIGRRGGLCLETQIHPDAIHHPQFPSAILPAGQPWKSHTEFLFCCES